MARKIRVGVLFGGRSGEHEVSLMSARSVMNAMDQEKYEIVPIGITKDGRWIAGGDPMRALEAGDGDMSRPTALLGDPSHRGLMPLEDTNRAIEAARLVELDVIFPVLHGPYGEDGTVQGLLELAGIPYVGAGVIGSALGMDKAIFKDVMRAHGLPVVDYVVLKRKEWDADPEGVMGRIEERFDYPVFTKPANLGSSVGISKCHDRVGLAAGLAEAARYDRKLLVEAAVPAAREIEVSVLGNDDPIASVPGEIIPSREFYSYEAKYIDNGDNASQLLIPAPLPPETTKRVRDLAIRAYKAIDCAGMARVDFLLSRETGELYISEVNTIPGFTSISMYPKLWEASGIPYSELIDRLIELALERYRDKERSETSYQPWLSD
ncbi:MAG: D-alanine--D-alanine ligase A [Chloroflexi bacterium]|nr:MAG: D-alanine--D-alanine ligase A [Chloroflexota bacterium]RLC87229.1 MAG: D-alanine--D-alanine ligase A [Chloroflexota bacterium]HEY66662.1 D-alanine--D-alanine ligase [Thermoflexia bacterium]